MGGSTGTGIVGGGWGCLRLLCFGADTTLLCITCMFPCHWHQAFSEQKGGHGIFKVSNNFILTILVHAVHMKARQVLMSLHKCVLANVHLEELKESPAMPQSGAEPLPLHDYSPRYCRPISHELVTSHYLTRKLPRCLLGQIPVPVTQTRLPSGITSQRGLSDLVGEVRFLCS